MTGRINCIIIYTITYNQCRNIVDDTGMQLSEEDRTSNTYNI